MAFCGNCGHSVSDNSSFCPHCGFRLSNKVNNDSKAKSNDSIIGKLNDYVGNTQPAEINWKVLFSDVFKPHTIDEAERIFICGTSMTTPHLNDVSKGWPHPWLYSRVLGMFIIAFVLLWICCSMFSNTNFLPGLIVVGSFAVPIATMIMFLEVNAYRDISLYAIVRVFLVGGCASLVATLFLSSIVGYRDLDYIGAAMVGIVEEVGKAVIVCFSLKKKNTSTILGGLLIGASVGAGFAAFESAGYAMHPLMAFFQREGYAAAYGQQLDASQMFIDINNSIFTRGFLAPGGHVAWAAISGAAFVIASTNKPLSLGLMADLRFLRLFAIPVILHALWDCPLAVALAEPLYISYISLCIVVWIVLLIIIDMGLAEINNKKRN